MSRTFLGRIVRQDWFADYHEFANVPHVDYTIRIKGSNPNGLRPADP